jgi:transposase
LTSVFADETHIAVVVTWSIYQRIIAAYAHPDRRRGKAMLARIIDSLRRGVPAGLDELAQLGRTLWRRRGDVLAYFDHNSSNGPTAINGRVEALRRNALGFRNLTQYRIRSGCVNPKWPQGDGDIWPHPGTMCRGAPVGRSAALVGQGWSLS